MRNSADQLRGLLLTAIVLSAVPCFAQRVQFPSGGASTTNTAFQGGAFTQPGSTATNLVPVQPSSPAPGFSSGAVTPGFTTPGFTTPGATTPGFGAATPGFGAPSGVPANTAPSLLGPPPFDPYSTSQGAALGQPSTLGVPQSPSGLPPNSFGGAQPLYNQPGVVPGQGFPQQPPVLYPNGYYNNAWNQNALGSNSFVQQFTQPGPYLKLLEDLRVIYTWVPGDTGAQMDTNDIEVATTLNFPNFLYSGYPISISPGFIFHFWNGPSPPIMVDLPSRMYSTYTRFDWNPMATPQFGAELSGSIGLYTDFDTVNHDSVRLIGKALLVYRLTPKFTLKGGIEYLDRVRIKLLPAGGVVWTPNDRVKFDIYFPRPKLAQYLITVGTTEVWWYLGGEYGYGSWTYERQEVGKMGSNRFDINDLRVFAGLEWTNNATTLQGFTEFGYVFNREVIFAETPADNFDLDDSLMLRAGIAF